jgi:hypothetical protein
VPAASAAAAPSSGPSKVSGTRSTEALPTGQTMTKARPMTSSTGMVPRLASLM